MTRRPPACGTCRHLGLDPMDGQPGRLHYCHGVMNWRYVSDRPDCHLYQRKEPTRERT